MKRSFRYVAAIPAVLILFLTSCVGNRERVIPRDDLAEIYAEMMIIDQWILNTPNVRLIADTSQVYGPILEKYGFDADDYRKSVDVYMDDPERFAKILRETVEILEAKYKDLEVRKAEMERLEKLRKEAEKFRPNLDFDKMFPYFRNEPYVHYHDSIAFDMDRDTRIYGMSPVELADTLYDGVRMVLKSVEAIESVAEPVVEPVVEPVAESVAESVAEHVEVQVPNPVPIQEMVPEKTVKPKTVRRMDSMAGERIEPIEINRQ